MACTSSVRREAQETVVQVDSLWRAGEAYTDSAALAKAYETLSSSRYQLLSIFNKQLATDYAHACYHYGKLLRAKEDPAAAMECFINATHARTSDYPILGRVYNNIGDICHIAGEYALSYEMFERSANEFLKDGDTLSYYYCLNDMAFELAVQGEKYGDMFTLLLQLESNCTDQDVLLKICETKAEYYKNTAQYDSAIYYASILLPSVYYYHTGFLIKAQSFSRLGLPDSAIYYANRILSDINSPYQHRFNALYVLSQNDSTLSPEEIREIASEREDIRYYEYEPQKDELLHAIQLLETDLHKPLDLRWLYAVIGIFLFSVSCGILLRIWKKRKQHQKVSMELKEKEEIHAQIANDIENLSYLKKEQQQQIIADVEATCQLLHESKDLQKELSWNDYTQMSHILNRRLYSIVEHLRPYNLTEKEVKLCVLILLQASTEQMVDIIPYARSGIGKFKYSTARKLGTTTPQLRLFLLNLICPK